jgi:hypothetical protein
MAQYPGLIITQYTPETSHCIPQICVIIKRHLKFKKKKMCTTH